MKLLAYKNVLPFLAHRVYAVKCINVIQTPEKVYSLSIGLATFGIYCGTTLECHNKQ